MACDVRRSKDGQFIAVVCSRGQRRPPKCAFCDQLSTKLCDYPVTQHKTCDAPICNAHAKKQGKNLDTCPDHPVMRYF